MFSREGGLAPTLRCLRFFAVAWRSAPLLSRSRVYAASRGGEISGVERSHEAATNLRVRCREHNLLYAEQTFGKEHIERKIRERSDPRKRGSAFENCGLAASSLMDLGFRRAEVHRALDAVSARRPAEELATIPVQTILREALAVLT